MSAAQYAELQQVIFFDREFGLRAFARKHKMTVRSLYHWRKKLGLPVDESVAVARRSRRSTKMFTVKAEIEARDGSGVRNVALFHAHTVRITPYKGHQDGVPGHSQKFNVELYDVNQLMIESLPIGEELDHYQQAYIMNEHGKTVERVMS